MEEDRQACIPKTSKPALTAILEKYDAEIRSMSETSLTILEKICRIGDIRKQSEGKQPAVEPTEKTVLTELQNLGQRMSNVNMILNNINSGLDEIV